MKGEEYLDIPGRIFFMIALNKELTNEMVSEAIKELFIYSANNALKLGFDILWHEVTNLELMKEYEALEGKFEPCYRFILRFD